MLSWWKIIMYIVRNKDKATSGGWILVDIKGYIVKIKVKFRGYYIIWSIKARKSNGDINEFWKKIEFSLENFMMFWFIRTQMWSYHDNLCQSPHDLSLTFLSFLSVMSISFPKLNVKTVFPIFSSYKTFRYYFKLTEISTKPNWKFIHERWSTLKSSIDDWKIFEHKRF